MYVQDLQQVCIEELGIQENQPDNMGRKVISVSPCIVPIHMDAT